jgi:hypothetical protein
MRELDLLRQLDAVPAAHAERRGAPLADAVERENRRLVEWARKKRAGRVALVVIGKRDRRLDLRAEVFADDLRQPDLFFQPDGNRHAEALDAGRRERQVGLYEPLEFPQRLLVEDDIVDVRRPLPCFA